MKQIGRYEIRDVAGRGGMATVYTAFDPHFKRDVAVKVMTQELLENDTLKARFTQEAQIIAALEHPAIVPVYDFGEDEMRPYLVMRLMTGGTLTERLQGGPLSVKETARILDRIGSALERAHEQGIIHRDLKPSNIMFDQYGDAFLADFGIARLTEGTKTLTGENVIGTPAYMSPEQIHGDQTVDGRSDIYALGVICFEMLTGQRPFQETAPARLMMQHIMDPVPDIREVRPDLPPGVNTIISRTMAKSPDERYAHASELTDTLDSLAAVDTIIPEQTRVEDERKDTALAAALIQDSDAGQVEAEAVNVEATIPDSAELAQPDRIVPTPTPPPDAAAEEADGEKGGGRKKRIVWVAAAAVVLFLLTIAALFFGDFFSSGESETAGVSAPTSSGELAETDGSDEAPAVEADEPSQPEEEAAAPDTAEADIRSEAEAFMEQFYASMDAEDYGVAEEAINQVLVLVPDEGWIYSEKAWLLGTTGDLDGALAEIEKAIELEPENGGFHAARGNIFREWGDLDAALGNHLRAVEIDPEDSYLRMELGETFMQIGDPGLALEQYNEAVAMKDDDAWFFESRANAYFLLGDIDMALADLERASELDPDQRDFLTQAGDIFLNELEDPERALEFYTRAVDRSPEEGWVYADRAAALAALGHYDDAMADLDRAIELAPENGSFYIRRGQLYLYELENEDAALADLNRAVEVDPENPDTFAERGGYYQYYAGNLEAALEDRSRALELEPDGPWRYIDRAVVLREMGRNDEALADVGQCLELDPDYYWCAWERAHNLSDLDRKSEAAADFQRFLDQAPWDDCPDCHEEAERYIQENG